MGRKITLAGRELFYEICELLGKPVTKRDSRIQPKHLLTIFGSGIRPGMYVKPMRRPQEKPRVVEAVERGPGSSLRIQFVDGAAIPASDIDSFERELTDAEVVAVTEFMANRVGEGAVALTE